MASGSLTWSGSNGGVRVNYTETLNSSSATSTITVTSVQIMSTKRYYYIFYAEGTVSVNGTQVLNMNNSSTYQVYVTEPNTWFTLSNTSCSGVSVPNSGNNSQATISIGAYSGRNDFNIYCYDAYDGNITISTGSQQISLTNYTTDSPSSVSATTPVTLGNSTTITVTRAKTSYTHTLQYSFDNSSWTNIATSVTTSCTWDTSDVAAYFSTTSAQTCYIRCLTYNGSKYIGLNSTSIYITATGTPSISSITVTPVNTNAVIQGWNNGNIFVQGYSTMTITVSYSLPIGTSLSACKIAVNGTTVSDSTETTFSTSTAISDSGTVGITATITDSRGGTGAGNTTITVYPYSRPYATIANAIRYSSDVNTEDGENGTNISAKGTISYSSVNGYNQAGICVRYKQSGGTYPTSYTTLTSGNANYTKINGSSVLSTELSYIVQFLIYDSLHPVSEDPTTIEMTIATAFVTFSAKDGGRGVAFFGYANTDGEMTIYGNVNSTGVVSCSKLNVTSYGTGDPTGGNNGDVYFKILS